MATTILVNIDNTLVATTKERIMQHSKNVHTLKIFVAKEYFQFDMTKFTATAEIVPPNQEYQVVPLEPCDTQTKEGYTEYDLDITSDYTLFSGDFQISLVFNYTDTDTMKSYVRHTSVCKLPIVPITQWSTLITDSVLTPLDQRLTQMATSISVLSGLADSFGKTKADNIAINDDGDLQLKANGAFVGDAVSVVTPSTIDDEDDSNDGVVNLDEIYEEVSI